MKTLLKIVIGIVAVFVLGIASVFLLTAGLAHTATQFFTAIKDQNYTAARSYLSQEFKASTGESTLESYLASTGITHFKDAHWPHRQITIGRGELDGDVVTDSGGVIPLKLTFIREAGAWKIYSMHIPPSGLQTSTDPESIPSHVKQLELIERSMHDFAVSVHDKSMAHFYGTLSPTWQQQITVQGLDNAFNKFLTLPVDLRVLDRFQPVIQSATVNENGVVQLTGYFPTHPSRVTFHQFFMYEGVSWKLMGFGVNIEKAPDTTPIPSTTGAKQGPS